MIVFEHLYIVAVSVHQWLLPFAQFNLSRDSYIVHFYKGTTMTYTNHC